MIYYFYSRDIGLKGAVNYKRIKALLADTREKAVKLAEVKYGISRDKPVGFVYSCRVMNITNGGASINNAYKSEMPVVITGCEYVEDIYTEINTAREEVFSAAFKDNDMKKEQ
ncbi:MAG: hypothetical protein IJ410_01030 [Oscillospiraceae bacterium]|nr:hypothetical protein [Oscillospiraceae bacterium]